MVDIEDTMADHMDMDTGERRRGLLMLGTGPTMVMAWGSMVDIEDTMADHMDMDTGERRRGLLMPSLQLMLMPMPMPTLGMDITDMHIVHMGMDMDTDMDTGERRRGLLTPPLMPMPLLTLTILDTMVLVL